MSVQNDPPRLAESEPSSTLGQRFASATRELPTETELVTLARRLEPVFGPSPRSTSAAKLASLGIAAGIAAVLAAALVMNERVPSNVRIRASASAPLASEARAEVPPTSGGAAAPVSKSSAATAPATSEQERSAVPATARVVSSASPGKHMNSPTEVELLERARRALASDPANALTLTQKDAALYPNGELAQEREVIAIEALRRLQRNAEAEQRARAFARAFPGSAHQRAVEPQEPK